MSESLKNITEYLKSQGDGISFILPGDIAIESYTNPERGLKGNPSIVFKPRDKTEFVKVIELLNKFKYGAVIFAGNTGLVSAQRATENAVIDLNNLDNIISLKLKNGAEYKFERFDNKTPKLKKSEEWEKGFSNWVRENNFSVKDFIDAEINCEGATPVGTINHVLKEAGIEVPIDMGSVFNAGGMTVGAGAANASHGTYGLLHGKASDLVIEANSVTGNGSLRVDKIDHKKPFFSEDETIINSAKAQYGNNAVGTQGTFAVITDLKLRTSLIPLQQHYFLIKSDSVPELNNIRKSLIKEFSGHLRQFEIMNSLATEIVRECENKNYVNPFYDEAGKPVGNSQPIGSKYLLMVEMVSDKSDDIGIPAFEFLAANLGITETNIAYAGGEGGDPEPFKKLRHSASGASTLYANKFGGANEHRITPDVSVPLKNIEKYINEITEMLNEMGCKANIFGHIGVGAFHLHIYSKENLLEQNRKEKLVETVFGITKKYDGSCWSEHGIGTANAKFYTKYTPKEFVNEWFAYKIENDRNNVLNPNSNDFARLFEELKTDKIFRKEILEVSKKLELKGAYDYIIKLDYPTKDWSTLSL